MWVGQGYTEVGGHRFGWEVNDVVVMPNFLRRRHVNGAKVITVSHRRHVNVSRRVLFSLDLLPSIATPQTGQR
jgi:gentisate 1,2-dioxygenase